MSSKGHQFFATVDDRLYKMLCYFAEYTDTKKGWVLERILGQFFNDFDWAIQKRDNELLKTFITKSMQYLKQPLKDEQQRDLDALSTILKDGGITR
jgi:hypothetical protein